MRLGLGAVAASGLASALGVAVARAANAPQPGASLESGWPALGISIRDAYLFLDEMMDAYAQGSTVRLCQSYSDQIAQGTFRGTAFVYDNALLVLAYLARGSTQDIERARVIGNGLLYAQQHDVAPDGRLRQTYLAGVAGRKGVLVAPGLAYLSGSAVGDVAWAGIALAQLHARTGIKAYLGGALAGAHFIEANTRDNVHVPPGGYSLGDGQAKKSTEHNIDVYALYTMLARLSGQDSWLDGARHARAFVLAMFDKPSGHFWTGTSDPARINRDNIPEDVNSWSYLALQDPDCAASIDWVRANLAVTDASSTRISGVTFASLSKHGPVSADSPADPDAVWLEGTAHMIAALLLRRQPAGHGNPGATADAELARALIENTLIAQQSLGAGQTANGRQLVAGRGLVAASGILDSGFGFNYYPCLHIGATAWYLMAVQANNPLQLAA